MGKITHIPNGLLAGALGCEVWTLLPYAADWRWGTHPTQTRWYPTMRLFRQPTWGNWGAVVAQAVAALGTRGPAFSTGAGAHVPVG